MPLSCDIRKLTDISSLVTIVLSNDDAIALKAEFDSNVIEQSHVDGFRKGKAPIHVVMAKVGRDKYNKDFREYIASKTLEEILKGKDLKPIITPNYEFSDWEPGDKFVFTATIYTQPPDPSEMVITPDLQAPPRGISIYSKPIRGIPGQMPIIDGKLPPHMESVDPAPGIPEIPQMEPSSVNIPQGDLTAPIHEMPKRPSELLHAPDKPDQSNISVNDKSDESEKQP